jgi:hypothetical protein
MHDRRLAPRPVLAAIVLGLLAIVPEARADSLEQIFTRANAAYFRGDYDEAAREYRRLVEAGVLDADVTYNLGAAEAKRRRYGAAIQQFERALWLRPGDDDAEQALAAVRAALAERRAAARGESEVHAASLGEAVYGGVSIDVLAGLALVFNTLFFVALGALVVLRRESLRVGIGIAAVIAAVGLGVSGAGLAVRSGWLDDGEPAVVLEERAPLREGPDARASERHHAPEGHRAWVLERDGDFALVRVPGVGEGWIAKSAIGMVRGE